MAVTMRITKFTRPGGVGVEITTMQNNVESALVFGTIQEFRDYLDGARETVLRDFWLVLAASWLKQRNANFTNFALMSGRQLVIDLDSNNPISVETVP